MRLTSSIDQRVIADAERHRKSTYRMLRIHNESDWAWAADSPLAQNFEVAWLHLHAPEAHWVLLDEHGEPRGRCSLWWRETPTHASQSVGLIGHFAAFDKSAALELLRHACAELTAHGCALAIGPMDGNTWRSYRLVTERGSEPRFFLEPDNPETWPEYFKEAGFVPLARYISALNPDLSQTDPRLVSVTMRLRAQGIRLRPLAMERYEEELQRLYPVCTASFQQNFLYTPITEQQFITQHQKLRPYVRPELVLLAEAGAQTVGFILALPDALQATRGEPMDTIVVKTVAVLPDRKHAGLGAWLGAHVQETARELGYRRAIHALMHDANRSRNISSRYAQPMRGYTLFATSLTR